jgi:hypothetical protein
MKENVAILLVKLSVVSSFFLVIAYMENLGIFKWDGVIFAGFSCGFWV